MRRYASFVAILLLLTPALAHAQWPDLDDPAPAKKDGSGDVAVIVAAENYLLLPDVDGAVDNANAWETYLRQSRGVSDVHVLANQDANRESILKFAKIAANDVSKEGRIWFVFIGHGAPTKDGKDGLLVGMDAQQTAESLAARGVRQSELLAALEADANDAIVVLDACFSGRAGDGTALAAGVQPVIAVDALPPLGEGTVVLTAARPNELAGRLPGASRPAFSYLVLGALRGWADDGDGTVTASEVLYFTRRELRGVKGRQQTPQASGNLQRSLAEEANEPKPDVDPSDVAKAQPAPERDEGSKLSKAEAKLKYLNSRVTYDGVDFRKNGAVLAPIAFYHAVERPELADEFSTHTPWMWLTGAAMTAGGIALMVWGLSGSRDVNDSGRIIGGFMGGFFTMGGGIALFVIGLMLDDHPVSSGEREVLAQQYNAKLRDEMGLGPEDDPPVERNNSNRFNPFSMNAPSPSLLSFGFRF